MSIFSLKSRKQKLHLGIVFAIIFFNLLAFQNCSKGFKVSKALEINSASFLPTPTQIFISFLPNQSLFKTSVVNISFDVTTTDNEALKSIKCQLGSNLVQDCISKSISFPNLADGDFILKVIAETTTGVISEAILNFRKDITAPVIMVSQSPASITGATVASFIFSVNENLSGGSKIECSLDNIAFSICQSPVTFSNLSVTSHNFRLKASDNAGNISSIYSYNWLIDLTAPTINLTSNTLPFTKSTSQTFTFTGTGVSSFQCQIDTNAFVDCLSPQSYINLSSAVHTFKVRGVSATGVLSSPISATWVVDTVPPTNPILTSNIGALTTLKSADMTFSSMDSGSGLAGYQCSLDNATFAACVSPLALTLLSVASHTFKVKALDIAGNISAESIFNFTVQQVDPLLAFNNAKMVIANRCASCHQVGGPNGATSFNLATEKDFVNSGLVVPGKIASSPMIYRLKNYPIDNGVRNMPVVGTLTSEEYKIMTDWVIGLSPDLINSNQFACDINELPDQVNAKRLSRSEYYNSIFDLISRALGDPATKALLDPINPIGLLPGDASGGYSTGDRNFSSIHAKAYFDIADKVSTQLVSTTNLSKFVSTYINYNKGTCIFTSASTLNTDCKNTLIRNFTLRAWGRPIEQTNNNLNNEYLALQNEFLQASSTTAGVEGLIFRTLISPHFLNHLQTDVVLVSGDVYKLSSYSMARRLSFLYSDKIPDEGLLSIAATNDLTQDAGFNMALDYVSQRMDPVVGQFTREWLHLDQLPGFNALTHEKFKYISLGITADDTLRKNMAQEIIDLVSYVSKNNRSYKEVLTSNISFARDPSLMKIYGQTTAAPATVTELNAVRLPAGERSGLLTRAGMLLSGSHSENPVMRGIHARKYLLCLTLADPPDNLGDALTPPVLDPNLTTRERYQQKTSGPACIGCHSQINPVGFSMSKYNALGGFQAVEPIFNESQMLVNNIATDSKVNLSIALGIDKDVLNAMEFSTEMANATAFKKCLTQSFYSYAYDLNEKTVQTNSCSMTKMYTELNSGATLQNFFKSAATDSRYRMRRIIKQ